jgi:hypothetical protein
MNSLMRVVLVALISGAASLSFTTPSEAGNKHSKHKSSGYFAPYEVRVIREYYAPRYRRLPPGLQKKLLRTGQLPPGWQKRFEPFPLVVERQLIVLPPGYRRGVLDGHGVVFDPRTQLFVDVAPIF